MHACFSDSDSLEHRKQLPTSSTSDKVSNILLLGTSGAGKYTVAKYVAGVDNFPEKYVYKGVGAVHNITSSKYKFAFIDTAGIQLDPLQYEKLSISKIRKELETHFPHGVHLVVIVVRKNCFTNEEVDSLAYIVETLFTKEARKYIALIHTGCENLDKIQRETYINKFAKNDGPSGKLNSLCEKKTLAVGFPNTEESAETYVKLHKQSISEGTEEVLLLCKSLENPMQLSDLFQQQIFSHTVKCVNCIVL